LSVVGCQWSGAPLKKSLALMRRATDNKQLTTD
jgi:hypothetical protein